MNFKNNTPREEPSPSAPLKKGGTGVEEDIPVEAEIMLLTEVPITIVDKQRDTDSSLERHELYEYFVVERTAVLRERTIHSYLSHVLTVSSDRDCETAYKPDCPKEFFRGKVVTDFPGNGRHTEETFGYFPLRKQSSGGATDRKSVV